MRMTKILLIFLCITLLTSCETYHFFTHKEAVRLAKKRNKKIGGVVIEDDNKGLKVQTTILNKQKVNEAYEFDDKGKQVNYTYTASCDSCFQIILAKQLKEKAFKWKKLNDSTYITRYYLKRFLNIHKSNFSFDYVKHSLNKTEYKTLIESTKK